MDNKRLKPKPKIALCAAFHQGLEIITHLTGSYYPIKFVATCHRDLSPFESKIAGVCKKKGINIYRKIDINTGDFISKMKKHRIDIVILAWWPDIIKKDVIKAARVGFVNLHPAFLPYGRGKHAYYWSIVDNTPFGAAIHLIDEGIDTGKVLFRKKIPVSIEDTGESLYTKGVKEVIGLF
ncbi:MAG: formyltransferase family protein, partial [Candidatus Omnitrophica bacterium]|nr:formyltransferase family protein [Candidatus Omnitrophota bacterium]